MNQPSAPTGPVPTMFEAIVRQMTVTATYNKGAVTIAPHILYTRHGEIYVDATTVERDGKPRARRNWARSSSMAWAIRR